MKKSILLVAIALCSFATTFAQEVKIVTVVESIVPNGLGRSRMIVANETKDFNEYTTTRTEEKDKDEKKQV